jgi:outer membrane protein assembly factor BamB
VPVVGILRGGFGQPAKGVYNRRNARRGHFTALISKAIMRHSRTWALGLLVLALSVACGNAAEQWPQWRGAKRDGQVATFSVPTTWPKELVKLWQINVGLGHSSPVVSGDRVYVFSRQDDNEVLSCFHLADGKQHWQQTYPAPYQVHPAASAHGKGPKSTPVISGSRIVTFGIGGILTCWDVKTGKRIWRRDFAKQFEKTSPLYGVAMSPIIEEEKCIVHVGGHDKGALMALNVRTGETIWSATDDGPGYSSPVIATIAEVRQVITQSQKGCLGVDLDDGKLLWRIPFTTEYDQNSITPLVHEGSVILSGINKGVSRYRIDKQDDEWETDEMWENREVSLYMSSPVADAERLYGFSHRQKGQLFAIDLTTGTTLWTSEGRLGDCASLVQTSKVVWALTTAGALIAFKAGDKQFDELARYHVAESATWAHPAFLSSGILVRDEAQLSLWTLAKPQ